MLAGTRAGLCARALLIPALAGTGATRLRDHMNPRSDSQPSESHSRRLPSAVTPSGWTIARDVHVTVEAPALMR